MSAFSQVEFQPALAKNGSKAGLPSPAPSLSIVSYLYLLYTNTHSHIPLHYGRDWLGFIKSVPTWHTAKHF